MQSVIQLTITKYVSWYLVVAMFVIGITPRVYAGFSPSEVISPLLDRGSDLRKIQNAIQMKMVREKLKGLGFTQDEIDKRLNQLNDSQIHQLALHLDELKVGGDGAAAVIIIILLLVILGGVILYLTGHRIVVTK